MGAKKNHNADSEDDFPEWIEELARRMTAEEKHLLVPCNVRLKRLNDTRNKMRKVIKDRNDFFTRIGKILPEHD